MYWGGVMYDPISLRLTHPFYSWEWWWQGLESGPITQQAFLNLPSR
jgi:hypothetical protein